MATTVGQARITDSGAKASLKQSTTKLGKIRWTHELGPGGSGAGVLTTDSGVTFTGDAHGNILALDTSDGKTLWHVGSGAAMQSSPTTYELDGRQYLLTGSGGVLFAWALPKMLAENERQTMSTKVIQNEGNGETA